MKSLLPSNWSPLFPANQVRFYIGKLTCAANPISFSAASGIVASFFLTFSTEISIPINEFVLHFFGGGYLGDILFRVNNINSLTLCSRSHFSYLHRRQHFQNLRSQTWILQKDGYYWLQELTIYFLLLKCIYTLQGAVYFTECSLFIYSETKT